LFAISLARPAYSSASASAFPTHSDPLLFKSPVIKNVWKDCILIFFIGFHCTQQLQQQQQHFRFKFKRKFLKLIVFAFDSALFA